MTDITFHAFYNDSTGVGVASLTPTVDVYRVPKSGGAGTKVVTAGNAVEEVSAGNGGGHYNYRYAGADLATYDYKATFMVAVATVQAKQLPALYVDYSIHLTGLWTVLFAGITSLANWLRGLYLKAAMDAAARTEIGVAYDPTTDSLEASRDNIGTAGVGLTALVTAIWASATRTLTSFGTLVADTVAALITAITAYTSIAPVTNSSITQVRGDRWRFAIAGLGDISTRSKLWVTIKDDYDHSDLDAVVQIEETAGLIRLNKAAGTAANGDIVVTDPVLGNIAVYLEPVESAQITADRMRVLDVQWLPVGTTDIETLRKASFAVEADVTRATS